MAAILSDFGNPSFPKDTSTFANLSDEVLEIEKRLGGRFYIDLSPPLPQVRAGAGKMVAEQSKLWPKIDGLEIKDSTVPGPLGEIPIRTYTPAVSKGTMIFIHGGGWVFGDLDREDYTCQYMAKNTNLVVVSIDYRLAPEHPYPGPIDDVFAASEWIVKNHKAPFVVAGNSAGGNMAAVVTASRKFPISAQFLTVPVTCHPSLYPKKFESSTFSDCPGLTAATMQKFWDLYKAPPSDINASPLLNDDLKGLPKTYIRVAGADPLRDEGIEYAKKLHEAGVPVTLDIIPGYAHSYYNNPSLKVSLPAHKRMADAVNWSLS